MTQRLGESATTNGLHCAVEDAVRHSSGSCLVAWQPCDLFPKPHRVNTGLLHGYDVRAAL